jgi:hypothetical protein
MRKEALLKLMKEASGKYQFLGSAVCLEAFKLLTTVPAGTLQEIRDAIQSGKTTFSTLCELGISLALRNTNKAKKYLDAASWIKVYAETHGEISPMTGLIHLPSGRKSLYYLAYLADRETDNLAHLDGSPAEQVTFLDAWRTECPYVLVTASQSMFTRCGVCEYLKALIDVTPRSQAPLINMVRSRLGRHFAFQSAQRLAQSRLEESARRSEGKMWQGPQTQSLLVTVP